MPGGGRRLGPHLVDRAGGAIILAHAVMRDRSRIAGRRHELPPSQAGKQAGWLLDTALAEPAMLGPGLGAPGSQADTWKPMVKAPQLVNAVPSSVRAPSGSLLAFV